MIEEFLQMKFLGAFLGSWRGLALAGSFYTKRWISLLIDKYVSAILMNTCMYKVS